MKSESIWASGFDLSLKEKLFETVGRQNLKIGLSLKEKLFESVTRQPTPMDNSISYKLL